MILKAKMLSFIITTRFFKEEGRDLISKVAEMDEARGPLGSCGVYVYTHLSTRQVYRLAPKATHSLHSSSTSSNTRGLSVFLFPEATHGQQLLSF